MTGYYTDDINFSVEWYNSAWIMRCRLEHDVYAETPEQINAIETWKNRNIVKYGESDELHRYSGV